MLTEVTDYMLDKYVARRCLEPGKKKGSTISPSTLNRELRNLRALLRQAMKWQRINRVPEIPFLKEMLSHRSPFQGRYASWLADEYALETSQPKLRLPKRRLGNRYKRSVAARPETPDRINRSDLTFLRAQVDPEIESVFGYATTLS